MTVVMGPKLPTVNAGHEPLGVGVGAGRQLHETIGARQAQKVAQTLRWFGMCPWAAPVIMFDADRQEIRERMPEGHRARQRETLRNRALRAHRLGDRRYYIANQTHQGR